MRKNIYFNVNHLGLGDTIALIPLVDILSKENNIFFFNRFNFLFEKEYPNIFFIASFQIQEVNNKILIDTYKNIYTMDELYIIGYHSTHFIFKDDKISKNIVRNSRLPLQKQFAKFLNINLKKEIKPKITITKNYNSIKEKYVCISTQTTLQGKYWNNLEGWPTVIDYLKKINYRVLCVDKDKVYGNPVYLNKMPDNAEDFTGKPLNEVVDIINNCDFFIGLDSGLSWIAWALNKKVIQILGLTGKAIAFENQYAIVNENVCNTCFADKSIDQFDSDVPFQNFLMCPKFKNTKRIFECTSKINPNLVINNIITITTHSQS